MNLNMIIDYTFEIVSLDHMINGSLPDPSIQAGKPFGPPHTFLVHQYQVYSITGQ